MKNYSSTFFNVLTLGLILVFGVLQYQFHISPVEKFEWIGFVDHDIIYQVERFLLNISHPDIEMLESGNMDYGSELFYTIPFYKIFLFFSSVEPKLFVYHFITYSHFLFFSLGLILLGRFFTKGIKEKFLFLVLLGIVLSSKLIHAYSVFIKPDPNIVFFSICAGLTFIWNFRRTGQKRYFYLTIIIASFGAAIKWWGGFLLFPLIFISFSLQERLFSKKFILLNLLGLLFVSSYILGKFIVFVEFLPLGAMTIPVFILVLFLSFTIIFLMLKLTSKKLWLYNNLSSLLLFFSLFLTLNLPILSSPHLLKDSFKNYSRFIGGVNSIKNKITGTSNYKAYNLKENLEYASSYAKSVGFINPFLLGVILVLCFFFLFKRRHHPFLYDFSVFILGFFFIYFIVLTRKNGSLEAMMYPLIFLFSALVIKELISSNTAYFFAIVVMCGFPYFLNKGSDIMNVSDYLDSRSNLRPVITTINENTYSDSLSPKENTFQCGRNIPLEGSTVISRDGCLASFDLLRNLEIGKRVLLSSSQYGAVREFPDFNKFYRLLQQFEVDTPGRFGHLEKRDYYLLEKEL